VVVGFTQLQSKSKSDIVALIDSTSRFDYYCWDLYARVSQWYEGDKERLKARSDALHAIEQGSNELAEIAELISRAVLLRHLETMDRLDIEYDFLPRESEILRLHFWKSAFELMKQKGVLYFETEGKNKGCWVMTRPKLSRQIEDSALSTKTPTQAREAWMGHPETADPSASLGVTDEAEKIGPTKTPRSSCAPTAPWAMSAKTLRITCGSLVCWGATSAIAASTAIPTSMKSGSPPSWESLTIRTSEMCGHLQRHRLAAGRSAEYRGRGHPPARLYRTSRALHAFLL